MAKKKSKLNTDLDDSLSKDDSLAQDDVSFSDDTEIIGADPTSSEDDVTYNMGVIQVDEAEEDDEEFKKASQVITTPDEESDEEWVVEEDYNYKDEDYFLDMEDFDPDNPGGEDIY